jgi:type IV pilus assembly protein PilY1
MGSHSQPTSWNAISSAQYASLTSAQVAVAVGGTSTVLTYQNLTDQLYVISGTNVNTSNNASVNWAACTSVAPITCTTNQFGWYVNLPGSNGTGSTEQVVSNPITYQQGLFVNTTIPAISNPLSCAVSTDTANTYIINSLTGGTFTSSTNSSKVSAFVTNASSNTVGQYLNMTGSLTIVNAKSAGGTYAIGQDLNPVIGSAPGQVLNFSLPPNVQATRVTWTQLR